MDTQPTLAAGPSAGADDAPVLDLELVVSEIYEEVQRRRKAGEYPPGLERELETVFAQYAPPAAVGDDLDVVLQRAERASFIDVDVPTASSLPGVSYAKRVLRKLMAWYLRYVAQQVSGLGGVLVRAMDVLHRRVGRLEEAVPAASPRVLAELRAVDAEPVSEAWRSFVVGALAGTRGRVLHAECGSGGLVGELVAAGVDAYGSDPRRELLGAATRAGLDVRPDPALDHLRVLPARSLGALVLTGVVDHTSVAAQLELADLAATVLAPGGILVLVGTTPEAWATALPVVHGDLSPGRPLHAGTWEHLLRTRGFRDIVVRSGERVSGGLSRVGDNAPDAATLNANLTLLEDRLFPPASYAVVATRP